MRINGDNIPQVPDTHELVLRLKPGPFLAFLSSTNDTTFHLTTELEIRNYSFHFSSPNSLARWTVFLNMTKICFVLTILSTTILIHTTVICQGNFNSFQKLSSIFSFLTLQSILKLKSFSDFKNKSDHYYTVHPADSPTMAWLPQGSPQWAPPSPLCSVLWRHRPPLRALLPPTKEPLSETPSSSSCHIPHMTTQHLHLS